MWILMFQKSEITLHFKELRHFLKNVPNIDNLRAYLNKCF